MSNDRFASLRTNDADTPKTPFASIQRQQQRQSLAFRDQSSNTHVDTQRTSTTAASPTTWGAFNASSRGPNPTAKSPHSSHGQILVTNGGPNGSPRSFPISHFAETVGLEEAKKRYSKGRFCTFDLPSASGCRDQNNCTFLHLKNEYASEYPDGDSRSAFDGAFRPHHKHQLNSTPFSLRGHCGPQHEHSSPRTSASAPNPPALRHKLDGDETELLLEFADMTFPEKCEAILPMLDHPICDALFIMQLTKLANENPTPDSATHFDGAALEGANPDSDALGRFLTKAQQWVQKYHATVPSQIEGGKSQDKFASFLSALLPRAHQTQTFLSAVAHITRHFLRSAAGSESWMGLDNNVRSLLERHIDHSAKKQKSSRRRGVGQSKYLQVDGMPDISSGTSVMPQHKGPAPPTAIVSSANDPPNQRKNNAAFDDSNPIVAAALTMNGIVMDAPIPPEDAHLHLKALFHLTKADYAMGLEEAMGIACRVLKPHLSRAKELQRSRELAALGSEVDSAIAGALRGCDKVTFVKNSAASHPASKAVTFPHNADVASLLFDPAQKGKAVLHHHIHKELRDADPRRVCRLYNRLTVSALKVVKGINGVALDLVLDTSQFPSIKHFESGKRLAHGNLLALSREWFTDADEDIIFGVIHRDRNSSTTTTTTGFENITLVLEFDESDRGRIERHIAFLSTKPSFQALESTNLFTPTQRILEALREQCAARTDGRHVALPLDNAILTGETNTTPQYLIAAEEGKILVGSAVLLRKISATECEVECAAPALPPVDEIQSSAVAAAVVADNANGLYNVDSKNIKELVEPWSKAREEDMAKSNAEGKGKHTHVLDATQASALQHMLSHRVSIVQGTPGTGKTFIGAKFIQILLENIAEGRIACGPILVLSQTNHAIDAVLEDVVPHIKSCRSKLKEKLGFRNATATHGLARLGSQDKEKQNTIVADANEYTWEMRKSSTRSGMKRSHMDELSGAITKFADSSESMQRALTCIDDADQNDPEKEQFYQCVFLTLRAEFKTRGFGTEEQLQKTQEHVENLLLEQQSINKEGNLLGKRADDIRKVLQQRFGYDGSTESSEQVAGQIKTIEGYLNDLPFREHQLGEATRSAVDAMLSINATEEYEDERVNNIARVLKENPIPRNDTYLYEHEGNVVLRILREYVAYYKEDYVEQEKMLKKADERLAVSQKELSRLQKNCSSNNNNNNNNNAGKKNQSNKGGKKSGGKKNVASQLSNVHNAAKVRSKEAEVERLSAERDSLREALDEAQRSGSCFASQIGPYGARLHQCLNDLTLKTPVRHKYLMHELNRNDLLDQLCELHFHLVDLESNRAESSKISEQLHAVNKAKESLHINHWRNNKGMLDEDEFQSASLRVNTRLFGKAVAPSGTNTYGSPVPPPDPPSDPTSHVHVPTVEGSATDGELEGDTTCILANLRIDDEESRREHATASVPVAAFENRDETEMTANALLMKAVMAEGLDERIEELLKEYVDLILSGKDTSFNREVVFQCVCWKTIRASASAAAGAIVSVAHLRKSIRDIEDERDAECLSNFLVIGATTSGCAGSAGLIAKLRPKIVIVEEAAEVLESHVVSCLTAGAEQLILIGDHKQLQPKIDNEPILGRLKNLNVSLMERLVRLGAPYVTLTTQRRMHEDISELHKEYYLEADEERFEVPAFVSDHPSTAIIPPPRGIANGTRVVLLTHSGRGRWAEQFNEGLQSHYNASESEYALAIYRHIQRCNPAATVTLLVPYLSHLLDTVQHIHKRGKFVSMRKAHAPIVPFRDGQNSDLYSAGLRVASIDNYQGEEDDFIILCLTRTQPEGILRSFLNQSNRACVALSRARRGMIVVGCEEAINGATSPMWKSFMSILRQRAATNPFAICRPQEGSDVATFPAVCPEHGGHIPAFHCIDSLEAAAQCDKMCNAKMACGHHCTSLCHISTSTHGKCRRPCERSGHECSPSRTCDHPCVNTCSDSCGVCQVQVTRTCRFCGDVREHLCRGNASLFVDCCSIEITCTAACGHEFTATCRSWKEGKARCPSVCQKKMDCGHYCPKPCHDEDDDHSAQMLECKEKKTVLHPHCRAHNVTVKCNTPATKYPKCEAKCTERAPCGHECKRLCCDCSKTKTHFCDRQTLRTLARCGHTITMPCNEKETPSSCTEPCTFQHACGHLCSGTCGTCYGSRFAIEHQQCTVPCGKQLICGHACEGTCSHEECPPCTKGCHMSCGHGLPCNGSHRCGDCVSCQSDCAWKCVHQQCAERCYLPCDRPPCDEPCPRKPQNLIPACNHFDTKCAGVCGESCPQFCYECFAESDTRDDDTNDNDDDATPSADPAGRGDVHVYEPASRFISLGRLLKDNTERSMCLRGDFSFLETPLDGPADAGESSTCSATVTPSHYRLVALPCCESFFLSGELDMWIDEEASSSCGVKRILGPIRCPNEKCAKPLMPHFYRRKGNAIKQRWSDISKILSEERSLRLTSILSEEEEGEDTTSLITTAFESLLAEEVVGSDDEIVSLVGNFSRCIEDLKRKVHELQCLQQSYSNSKPANGKKKGKNAAKMNEQKSQGVKTLEIDIDSLSDKLEQQFANVLSRYPFEEERYVFYMGKFASLAIAHLKAPASTASEVKLTTLKIRTFVAHLMGLVSATLCLGGADENESETSIDTIFDSAESALDDAQGGTNVLPADLHWTLLKTLSETLLIEMRSSRADFMRQAIATERRRLVAAEARRKLQASNYGEQTPSHIDPRRHSISADILKELVDGAKQCLVSHNLFFRGKGTMNELILNPCLKDSCSAAQRFLEGAQSLAHVAGIPSTKLSSPLINHGIKVTYAFHGTSAAAIGPICCRGFDTNRRSGQAHGPGEYFAEDPKISDGYSRQSNSLLVCAIVESVSPRHSGVVSRPVNNYVVVNNPRGTPDPDRSFAVPVGIASWKTLADAKSDFACSYPVAYDDATDEEGVEAQLVVYKESMEELYRAPLGLTADLCGWIASRTATDGNPPTNMTADIKVAISQLRRIAREVIRGGEDEDNDYASTGMYGDNSHNVSQYNDRAMESAKSALALCERLHRDLGGGSAPSDDDNHCVSMQRAWFVCPSVKRHVFYFSAAKYGTVSSNEEVVCPLCSSQEVDANASDALEET